MRKFEDIIERIEYIRNYLGLNKSRFSAEIGMKPQTYNNFIGSQGSKPNIELIHGIVNRFLVNPIWLLNGNGSVFSDQQMEARMDASMGYAASMNWVREGDQQEIKQSSEAVRELREQLKSLEPLIQETEKKIREVESSQVPMLNGLIKLLGKYIETDPVGAAREVKEFLWRLENRLNRIK